MLIRPLKSFSPGLLLEMAWGKGHQKQKLSNKVPLLWKSYYFCDQNYKDRSFLSEEVLKHIMQKVQWQSEQLNIYWLQDTINSWRGRTVVFVARGEHLRTILMGTEYINANVARTVQSETKWQLIIWTYFHALNCKGSSWWTGWEWNAQRSHHEIFSPSPRTRWSCNSSSSCHREKESPARARTDRKHLSASHSTSGIVSGRWRPSTSGR